MKPLPFNPAPLTLEQMSELVGTRPEELKTVKAIAQRAKRQAVLEMVRRKRAVVAVAQAKRA